MKFVSYFLSNYDGPRINVFTLKILFSCTTALNHYRRRLQKKRKYGKYWVTRIWKVIKIVIRSKFFPVSDWLKPTSFPGSLNLPLGRAKRDPDWVELGLVTCHFDNSKHQGRVLSNQGICRVELCRNQREANSIALRPTFDRH